MNSARLNVGRWVQWGVKDVWRFWSLIAACVLPVALAEHAREPEFWYTATGGALALVGLGIAWAGTVGAQEEFAQRFGGVVTRSKRREQWLARAPWKSRPGAISCVTAAGLATMTASGYGAIDGSNLPLDQRLKLLESTVNGLSETLSRIPAQLQTLDAKIDREVQLVTEKTRADNEHTAHVLTSGTDDALLGLALGGIGTIFATFAPKMHPLLQSIWALL